MAFSIFNQKHAKITSQLLTPLIGLVISCNGFLHFPTNNPSFIKLPISSSQKNIFNSKQTARFVSSVVVDQDIAKAEDVQHQTKKPTIAVVGSGAVGCYYGARLWESNHDVKFLARGEHLEACTKSGLNVTVKLKLSLFIVVTVSFSKNFPNSSHPHIYCFHNCPTLLLLLVC